MKKITFIALFILSFSFAFAQECELPIKKGQSYVLSSVSYQNIIGEDVKKWTKMDDKKKAETVTKHNEEVLSGKMKPKTVYDMTYTVDEEGVDEGGVKYAKMSAKIGAHIYTSYVMCDKDTMMLVRNLGVNLHPIPQGGYSGYDLLGVQKLPLKIKVGDVLEPYADHTYTTAVHDITVTKIGSITKHYITFVPTQAVETSTSHTIAMHYVNAKVTGTTEYKMGGKTYTAYIIESETWIKTTMKNEYTSDDKEVNIEKSNRLVKKLIAKHQSEVDHATGANKEGYIVSPRTEWYVPELGIVNLVVNSFGFIVNETKVTAIK